MIFYPYNVGSASAGALAQHFGSVRLRHNGLPRRTNDLVVNWGCSVNQRGIQAERLLNDFDAVALASNKLLAFQAFHKANIPIPRFTTNKEEAEEWIEEGKPVVCRTTLKGHSGQGIVIANKIEDIVEAPLYTQYIPKRDEYRVHVVTNKNGGHFRFTQRKARQLDVPDEQVNWQIRNHDNGFIYQNKNVRLSEGMMEIAIKAIESLGLDFGAVDIIYNERSDNFYVLEVNTAPGLVGATLEFYINYLEGMK